MKAKSFRNRTKGNDSNDKILAAKVLIKQTKGSYALSHREEQVAAQTLAGVRDKSGARVPSGEVSSVIQRPHVRDVLVEALAQIGVGPEKLARVLAEGLDADRYVGFDKESQSPVMTKDHQVRHKFLETALSVVGVRTGSREAAPPSNVFVFRSFLGDKPVDVEVGAPTDAIVSRRLAASKVRNRSHA